MHLISMTYDEATIVTKAISEGLVLGVQDITTEINAFMGNPNAPGISKTAKKQVNEWNQLGYDSTKIEEELKN